MGGWEHGVCMWWAWRMGFGCSWTARDGLLSLMHGLVWGIGMSHISESCVSHLTLSLSLSSAFQSNTIHVHHLPLKSPAKARTHNPNVWGI
jgi:hypothetical protein